MESGREVLPVSKDQIDIRIQLYFKPYQKKSLWKKKFTRYVVQGMPVHACILVTNLSNKVFKGAALKKCVLHHINENITNSVNIDIQLPSLNPKSSIDIEIDAITFHINGACFIEFDLIPESQTQVLQCYQYDDLHRKDEAFSGLNKWLDSFYVEGKLSSLQTKTNNYILALTIITVLEAIFGIKNILISIAYFMSIVFNGLGVFFQYLAGFT